MPINNPHNAERALVTALALFLLCAGCAPTTGLLRPERSGPRTLSRSPYGAVKTGIDELLPDTLFPPSMVGIQIISLDRNDTLYELNPSNLFTPASNQKIFTTGVALSLLGSSASLASVVYADTASRRLLLRGFGDPLMTQAELDTLARTIARNLPAHRTWSVGYDVTYFDREYWGSGWAWDDEPSAYQAYITPLVVDDNTVTVSVSPGARVGERLLVELHDPTGDCAVENSGVTVADSVTTPLDVSRKWRERSNLLTVHGEMKRGSAQKTVPVAIWQPERHSAALFAWSLRSAGIAVDSVVEDSLRSGLLECGRFCHTLDSAVVEVMKESDNLGAEVLLKVLGAERRGLPGSAAGGISVIREFLAGLGIDTTRSVIADGSGLSRYNLTSPSMIVDFLAAMHRRNPPSFYASFPVAGVDGTLANRMKGTRAEGNLRAKTGTESGVTTLSGYVRTRDGELLAFSIMMQNFPGSAGRYRAVQDWIGEFLAGMSRKAF